MPERMYVPWCEKALYKYSSFPFLSVTRFHLCLSPLSHRVDVYVCVSAAPKLVGERLESTRTLKSGTGLVQQFTVSGVPTPSVSWSLNGQPLDSAVISSSAELTSLAVKKCSVKDAGQYQVTATNDVGTDSVRFTVVVNGPSTSTRCAIYGRPA